MPTVTIVGAQWGDEGKGKLVDIMAEKADVVARFQGGPNAGHTVYVKDKKVVLHQLPSGVFRPECTNVLGAGMVLDPETLAQELEKVVEACGGQGPQLLISDLATVIFPYHKELDLARENFLGESKIGTTGKGIGPAYEDRASRRAILVRDLFSSDQALKILIERNLQEKNTLLKGYGVNALSVKSILEWVKKIRGVFEPYRVGDVSLYLHRAYKAGKKILFEGAQGAMLDLYHGTYPYVTSSNTLAAAAASTLGISSNAVDMVIGVTKAYTTRVGAGPFPSEIEGELGEDIRNRGQEFGSTTGRPRRCGWLDLVALRYAIRTNGITNLALMKIDVLSFLDQVGVVVAYEVEGKNVQDFPIATSDWSIVKPVIEFLPGWKTDLAKVMSLKDLPRNTTNFIDFVSNHLATPIDIISVGPLREQTLWVKPLFH